MVTPGLPQTLSFYNLAALWHSMGIDPQIPFQMFARERDHLTHFLTYADNNAVGYFAKQGFTKEITLDRDRVGP